VTALVVVGIAATGCTAVDHAAPTPTARAASYISGQLRTVEPVSGRTVPLTIGTVLIVGTMKANARVDSTGHFRIAVRPGLYTVSGSVDAAHPDFHCHPEHGVSVATGATVTVDVQCPSDAG
jgi:hypothetical protein